MTRKPIDSAQKRKIHSVMERAIPLRFCDPLQSSDLTEYIIMFVFLQCISIYYIHLKKKKYGMIETT